MLPELTILQSIAVWTLPVLFGIIIHEVAHGFIADKLGDKTARLAGRLTLNPIKHIDLIGTIIVPALMLAFSGYVFGWAKPVPVNTSQLKHQRRDTCLVALAGPLANGLMSLAWTIGLLIILNIPIRNDVTLWFAYSCQAGMIINVLLMIFNVLPIPPLDGSMALAAFLRGKVLLYYLMAARFGLLILFALLLTGVLQYIISPMFAFVMKFLVAIVL